MAQTGTDITRVADALIDAFNAADWDRLRPLVADDVVYTETGTGRRMEGADAYFALLEQWKGAFPDVAGTVQAMVAGDGVVAQEIHWEGTQTGPLETPGGVVPASGRRISVEATAWFRFRGETIREIHHHLDVLMLLHQIGAIPAPAQ
jgi:steroid delta-isomerase-like uncharacterized protein